VDSKFRGKGTTSEIKGYCCVKLHRISNLAPLVKTQMKLWVPEKAGNFLTRWSFYQGLCSTDVVC